MKILKKIYFFVIFLIGGFLINLTFQSDSLAFLCETDVNGAILLSSDAVNGTQVVGSTKTPFKFINDKIGGLGSNFTDQCNAEPDEYKITFYKVGLCTEDPYLASVNDNAGGNPTFTSCFDILNSPSGKTIIIKPDEENNDLLDGESLNLPIGSYKYFYAIVNNHLHVKHIQSFKTELGAAADMWGNGDSQEGVRNICYTVAVVTTNTGDHANDNAYETAHNVDVVASGSSSDSQLKCTASMDDAVANAAFAKGLPIGPSAAMPGRAAAKKGIAGLISLGISFLILRLIPEKNPIVPYIILLKCKKASLVYMPVSCILLVFLSIVNR